MIKARPKSSGTYLTTAESAYKRKPPSKHRRVEEQDVYNMVRNHVYETFKVNTSRTYDLIKQMTNQTVPERQERIDSICKKYSIINKKKNRSFEGVDVDVDEIVKQFVKSKSQKKQKEESREKLKKDISKNYRYGPNREYRRSEEFFSFKGNNLKQLEKKHFLKYKRAKYQEENMAKSFKHPYLEIYEKAQTETVKKIQNNFDLTIFDETQCPDMPEIQEWERNTILLKEQVSQNSGAKKPVNIKNNRTIQSARVRPAKPTFSIS